ncbi:MAG: hypothetical protein COV29_00635 [Candidatus Yanofskybacteria bacterium CG10_big_fil_rev_8_21_14_0_10_36_16]|uniref:Uncharacterized protein n=1 Tax=Candidatus Yanofskybacteria bacterium CG10_big_fil_rev_8_21_14_0_10_36_16 TaxID=1975096 RepID=A0A2J0Q8D0_9BACT|nr:MAG: hypothetical protein COV29_00635 [Candidatus Yanofskybacteria bacterium CG10_big_fil_rev_8_21_14_0_10_36_16]
MAESHKKLAKILNVEEQVLLDLDKKMSEISGKTGVMEEIVEENDKLVDRTLDRLGLSRKSTREEIFTAMSARLKEFEMALYEYLDRPKLDELSEKCGKLCEVALRLKNPGKGFFVKKEKAIEMLEKFPPGNLLEHFKIDNVKELIDKKGFSSVFSSLRFAQDTEWMHRFFDEAYNDLTPDDFEERDVEIKVLEKEWLDVAERFLKKKYHNLSHLKELGIVFIVPIEVDDPGEYIRLFVLLLHYLNEVPYYSGLFRKIAKEPFGSTQGKPNFTENLKSLLRGDVISIEDALKLKEGDGINWAIIQRYLTKDNKDDPRLFVPHVNPEAEHWYKAGRDLSKIVDFDERVNDEFIRDAYELDFVGDFFSKNGDSEELKSFDLVDAIMTLVSHGEIKYLYHQQEALWNKIFIGYMGRDKMNELVEDNILKGFLKL